MARLLVSVRSAEEAKRALAGGASIIDVKEPSNGSLGRAAFETWREVYHVVPAGLRMSVALGELSEWLGDSQPEVPPKALDGVRYCKVGFAGVGPNWVEEWAGLADRLNAPRVQWIAVVYTDWKAAGAPSPTSIFNTNFRFNGVLFDTWDKSKPAVWTSELIDLAAEFREDQNALAVAGGLTRENLDVIAAIRPDIVAVRGAVCEGGDRLRDLDQSRVEQLAEVVRKLPEPRR
ncbi:(5-formylfuran-3-yl)methyl phosphate synthase [Paludisphaera rhizosphaerae]|uniref:(5-formylfuran-3-yl)methyl phosphate synthase n=1 Tax=Paludisphaera rhizosphaerae TaxID=2711216 RepID=UPI0013EDFF2C|nr:(5-formylfuran-3-yl)methyl phosphate synthase [Paludisphaera rhizosphaerae]